MNSGGVSARTKLVACFATSLAFTLCSAGISIWTVRNLNTLIGERIRSNAQQAEWSGQIDATTSIMRSELRGVLLAARDREVNGDKLGQFEKSQAVFRAQADKLSGICQRYEAVADPAGRASLDKIRAGLGEWLRLFDNMVATCNQGKHDEARATVVSNMRPIMEPILTAAANLAEAQRSSLKLTMEDATTTSSRAIGMAMVLGAAMIVAALVGLFVSLRIAGQLRAVAERIASGSGNLNAAANQIATSSQTLAQSSSEQAASLEETSASAHEISSMAHQNRERSTEAAKVVESNAAKVDSATAMLDKMAASIAETVRSSEKVSGIIKLIDEISFQTNILALNAAVEAARAGEAGMGFAVVADEVRNLAHRCAEAARETSHLIELSVQSSNQGRADADRAAAAVRSIVDDSARLKVLVGEVAAGSGEQATGIEQIARAITQMEQTTQSIAANSEESAAASQELNSQAETLESIVHELTAMAGSSR